MNFFLVQNGGALVASDVIRKETSSSFELGLMALLDGNLQINGAVAGDVDDMQFFEFFVGPFGLLRATENIDEVSLTALNSVQRGLLPITSESMRATPK